MEILQGVGYCRWLQIRGFDFLPRRKEYEEYKYKEYQGKCLKNFSGGGKCPGGICPRGVIVRGYLSGGNCPGGNCPDTVQAGVQGFRNSEPRCLDDVFS